MVRFRTGMWLGPLLALAIVGACGGESDSDDPSDSIGGEGGEGGDGPASGSGGTLIQGGASDGGSGVDVSGGGGFAGGFPGAGRGGSSGDAGHAGAAADSGIGGHSGDGAAGSDAGAAGVAGGEGGAGGGSPRPVYNAVVGTVDDLEDGDNAISMPYFGVWRSYNDGTGSQTPPPDPLGAFPWSPAPGGSSLSPQYAACTRGSGFDAWGAGIAFDFSNALGRKGVLDARAVYGVRFQIKGTGRIRLAVPTTQTASIGAGGSCVPNASAGCDFHATTPLTLNANWTSVAVLFASLTPGGASVFDPAAILGMAFEAWGVPGSLPVTDFDFCVDDVELF